MSNKPPATKGLSAVVGTSNAYASWAERLLRLVGVEGWTSLVFVLASSTALGSIIHFLEATPWWVSAGAGLFIGTYLLKFGAAVRIAWAARGVSPIDVQELARDCEQYYREYSSFMAQRLEGVPRMPPELNSANMERHHREMVDFNNRSSTLVLERFGARAFAIAHQFQQLGITPPNMFHFPHGDTAGAGMYIGTVGELLKKGLLEDARKLDPNITWGATFR